MNSRNRWIGSKFEVVFTVILSGMLFVIALVSYFVALLLMQ